MRSKWLYFWFIINNIYLFAGAVNIEATSAQLAVPMLIFNFTYFSKKGFRKSSYVLSLGAGILFCFQLFPNKLHYPTLGKDLTVMKRICLQKYDQDPAAKEWKSIFQKHDCSDNFLEEGSTLKYSDVRIIGVDAGVRYELLLDSLKNELPIYISVSDLSNEGKAFNPGNVQRRELYLLSSLMYYPTLFFGGPVSYYDFIKSAYKNSK